MNARLQSSTRSSPVLDPGFGGTPSLPPRFLSEADCHDILQRLMRYAKGGGETAVHIASVWTGNVRWARNRIYTTGEDRDVRLDIQRKLRGAGGGVTCNEMTDMGLVAATRRAERLTNFYSEKVDTDLTTRPGSPFRWLEESVAVPQLFFASTFQLDAGQRAAAARALAQSAADAGMLSAGYIEVSATSFAYLTSWGEAHYNRYTWAQYSVTVRDPKGVGSGWAGVDWPDWNKIDGPKLSAIALDKCLKSRNPVAVEPGRYTTILEPQAVCIFIGELIFADAVNRKGNEMAPGPFHKSGDDEPIVGPNRTLGLSRRGEKVIDERITISVDPMDPELGFPPFDSDQGKEVFHSVTWIENGVLKTESYNRDYAVGELGQNTTMMNEGAFRMSVSGATTSMEEMIATTKRGLLVTRFDRMLGPDGGALLCRGYTRDGLWLIENGIISKAVKNMVFVESVLFALNNVEQLGVPQRAFHPIPDKPEKKFYALPRPVIVPPMKIRDFSFTALSEAI